MTKRIVSRSQKTVRAVVGVAVTAPLLALLYYLAFLLRFEGNIPAGSLSIFKLSVGFVVLAKLVVFSWMGLYRNWSRFVTFHDLQTLIKATAIGVLLFAIIDYLLLPNFVVPRSIFLLDWGISLVVLGGLRSFPRLTNEVFDMHFWRTDHRRVLIIGANESGEALLRAIRRSSKLDYRVVGFVTEHASDLKSRIEGVPVVGMFEKTRELVEQQHVEEILITSGELSGIQVRQLVDDMAEMNVMVKVMPSYEQILHGNVSIRPREVSIEDLLKRRPVELDTTKLHQWIDDRVVLVTGSAGSIGSEICRQILHFRPQRIVLVDRSENGQFFLERELKQAYPELDIEVCIADLTDQQRMQTVFEKYRPSVVLHAAAYKHVPLMEDNPGEAVKNIVLSTRNLADLADRMNVASFVMISTDKAVNPTSVMGACKRVAERYVQSIADTSSCRFITVRFGNVLDSDGSVIPIFRQQIAAGGPITVTHPMITRYFMTIPEASQLVLQAGILGEGGEIFVLDMGDPVRIVDLATDMIRLSGLREGVDVEISYVGLRPGEKLFEELYGQGEVHEKTSHPEIMVAESIQRETINIARLASVIDSSNDQVVAELQRLLPEFRSDTKEPVEVSSRRMAA